VHALPGGAASALTLCITSSNARAACSFQCQVSSNASLLGLCRVIRSRHGAMNCSLVSLTLSGNRG
jgi:hypothetical protein